MFTNRSGAVMVWVIEKNTSCCFFRRRWRSVFILVIGLYMVGRQLSRAAYINFGLIPYISPLECSTKLVRCPHVA
jgi:hypothetical protein